MENSIKILDNDKGKNGCNNSSENEISINEYQVNNENIKLDYIKEKSFFC